MSEPTAPTYPDILGLITGGDRFDAGGVHLALAVRPRVVRAGRVFEAVLLLQNATDASVDVTGRLIVPEQDAQGKHDRFVAPGEPLSASLRPAEAGYVALPVTVLPDAAPAGVYTVAVAVQAQLAGTPLRIEQSGSAYLPSAATARLTELKSLAFSTARRGLFGLVIEAPFSVLPPQTDVAFAADWVSLWSPDDHAGVQQVLERYGDLLRHQLLAQFNLTTLFAPLYQATETAVSAAGYALQPAETYFITRLLAAVLELAAEANPPSAYPGQAVYHVGDLLARGWPTDGSPIPLPNWCRALLDRLAQGEALGSNSVYLLAGALYDDLLRDAVAHGFALLHLVAPLELGSDDDKRAYGEQLVDMLHQRGPALQFVDVYLPLVLGGIIAAGRSGPIAPDHLNAVTAICQHQAQSGGGDSLVADLIQQVLEWARAANDHRV